MRLYILERVFYNNNDQIERIFDHGLVPMPHEQMVNILNKQNRENYKLYNCIDRLREISISEIINERYPHLFSETTIDYELDDGDYNIKKVLEVLKKI